MAYPITQPIPFFADLDGTPLDGGYVWYGVVGLNPETSPIVVYWDAAKTLPAAQPIRTIGGMPSLNGKPSNLYADSDFSITVKNAALALVLTIANAATNIGAPSGSSLVGFLPAGTGAVATDVQTQLRLTPRQSNYATNAEFVSQAKSLKTGKTFTQDGSVIRRVPDRLLVGDAIDSDAAFPNVLQDWLTQFRIAEGFAAGPINIAQLGVLTNQNKDAGFAFVAGAQSLNFTSAGTSAIGISSYALNNNPSLGTLAWAFYGEAHRTQATSGQTLAMELDTRSIVATSTATPYGQGSVIGLQLASGCGASAVGQFDASAAIQIEANPMAWKTGIVFGATAITGTDGTAGSATTGIAIAMARRHVIQWYEPTTNTLGAAISSAVTSAAGRVQQNFVNNGINFIGAAANNVFTLTDTASGVNYLNIASSATGTAVRLTAAGTDTDVDIFAVPKGAGVFRFGTFTGSADVACNGYITIKDAGGTSRKLMTTA